jgi:hypothetical protein
MADFNTIYDIIPKSLFVTDGKGDLVYGTRPCDVRLATSEYKITLCDKEYTINYGFLPENKEYIERFPLIFETLVSLARNDLTKTYRKFSYLYTFLCSIMKNEVSDTIKCESVGGDDVLGTAFISEKGLITVFAIITYYLSKNVSVPSFSYKNNIESLEISIFSEDAKKEIPVLLCDYCREIAKNGGFSLEFSYKDGRALMTSRIDSVSSKGISFTAPMPEDYTFVSLLCALLVV